MSIVQKDSSPDLYVNRYATQKAATPDLVASLKSLLADAVTFYLRAHGAHWNVKGSDFAEYHTLFAAIYSDTYESVDPIAENLRKMGAEAPFRLSEFMNLRSIQDVPVMTDPASLAADLLGANDMLLAALNRAFGTANAANEQGVANFIAERIDAHQKWAWQLRASLGLV